MFLNYRLHYCSVQSKHRLELLGYQPTKPELDQIYQHFLVVADEKKKVENEDLIALVGQMPVFTK